MLLEYGNTAVTVFAEKLWNAVKTLSIAEGAAMRGLWKRKDIDFVERNIHGAWVIWGSIGIRQYYYYTKREAIRHYRAECAAHKQFVNQPVKKR